tara:strand:+ start:2055 stop:3878 length:1824 start_codon:yes stop_codon:yes gene_type:complete
MANQIRFKRASGSDPGASDLVLGEPAVRTDTGELFFKKDDGSVAKVSGGGITDGDKGDITVSNSGGTFTVDNDVVTFAKMQNIFTQTIMGRLSNGTGDATMLNASDVRTIINVENGATADQTKSDIDALGVNAATVTVSDESSDTSCNVLFAPGASGNKAVKSGSNLTFNSSSGLLAASGFSGDGSSLTSLNASNISSGTISDDRLPATISSDITGSAATLTNARNIAGSSFNGSASIDIDYNNLTNLPTIPSNTNQLTNGAGFITATLTNEQVQDIVGGMVSSNTESGITVTYQDGDGTLDFAVASQTDNNFTTTLKNKLDGIESGATADQSASEILTLIKTVDGAGSGLDADTLDGVSSGEFLRSNAADTANSDITFNGGAGAATIAAGSDIRFTNGDWTGNSCKIQHHSNYLYIVGGSAGIIFREDGTNRWIIDGSGHFDPAEDSTYDIGSNGVRVRNGYFDTLYGSGANLTNLPSQTDNNFTNADHSKLDGIAAGATNVTNNNQISNGAGYVTSSIINSLNASNLSSGTIPDARFPSTLPAVSGANLTNISATVAGGAVYENAQSITSNYTVTNGKNAMSAGPISIASGVTVTVGSGETYTIV